jgi:hypothetical protein
VIRREISVGDCALHSLERCIHRTGCETAPGTRSAGAVAMPSRDA